jgi:hypothetical protein|tara:strand:+ start:285 stop:575 length:291 start_codon:yes stop_codon:yes gene_type:complete
MAGSIIFTAFRDVGTDSDGVIYAGPARLRQLTVNTESSGSPKIILKDGGSGGVAKLTLDLQTGDTFSVNIPDEGIKFDTNIFVDETALDGVTVFLS